MIKVYLDTNVLILGCKKLEHDGLKKLSQNKQVILYKSLHGDIEQHGKIFPTRRKRDLTSRDLWKSPEKFNEFKKADSEYEETCKQEDAEKNYWSDAVLTRAMSSFDTLVVHYASGLIPDRKGELILLQDLIIKYGLGDKDALHTMSAHSAGMNYLLTWDKKGFINKCKNITWLTPKVTTPKEFLSTVKFE